MSSMSHRTWITLLLLGTFLVVIGICILSGLVQYVILFGISYGLFSSFLPWGIFSLVGGAVLIAISYAYEEED